MAVKLNNEAFEHAKKLIQQGRISREGDWSQEQPTPQEGDAYIDQNGIKAYSQWHLGINTEHPEDTKGHWEFPYGDFVNVCRSGIIAAKQRAGQYKHTDIEEAAGKLLDMIDKK